MEGKQFNYQEYLDKYENCPMEECIERNIPAFSWVHLEVQDYDFIPNRANHPLYKGRTLDDTDTTCEHIALSVYKDLKSAIDSYLHEYNSGSRKTEEKRQKFRNQKGDCIALLNINENDGVSDEPNEKGHFSFFPYTTFDHNSQTIKEVIPIFEQ